MRIGRKPIGTVAYLGGLPSVIEEFCWSWAQMVQYNSEYMVNEAGVVHYDRTKVSLQYVSRNTLADRFLGDWLLMIDTDHAFDPDILMRLLRKMEQYKVDVLSALYQSRWEPHQPVMYKWRVGRFEPIALWELDPGEELLPVDSVGAGTLLIKRNVFDRISKELSDQPFDIIPPWGEDHSFFRRLMRLGIKVYVDPGIQSYHLATKPIDLSYYNPDSIEGVSING